jgi:hypothetical protein
LQVKTGVDPAKFTTTSTYAQDFLVLDKFTGKIDTTAKGILSTLDTDTTAGPTKNWTPVKPMSNKKDCKLVSAATAATTAAPAKPAMFSCSIIDAHFFRNWWTDSGD